MIIRPVYCWKSFWLGLLALGFLASMWVRSLHFMEHFTVRPGPREFAVGQAAGEIKLYWVPLPVAVSGSRVGGNRLPFSPRSTRWLAPAFRWEQEDRPGHVRHRTVHFAHWLVVLLFLVPWATFLLWRHARCRRLLAERPVIAG